MAFEAAQRALDKQEKLLEELRARSGVLLAAASLSASFLGARAFDEPHHRWLLVVALLAFLVSVGAAVYDLQRFWDQNEQLMRKIIRAYRASAAGLVAEIASLGVIVSGTIFT